MTTMRPGSRGAVMAAHLLAWGLLLVGTFAGVIALLCILSLGMAAGSDLLRASLPELMAGDADVLGAVWTEVRERLIVSTGVAIVSVMGAREAMRRVGS